MGENVINVIFTGVGGQGSIVASHILAEAALRDGRPVKLAETYGGATRGGAVVSHVRIGEVWSPIVPEDEADVVVAMEPLEGLRRALKYLKPSGWALLNTHRWLPVDVTAGGLDYPPLQETINAIKSLGGFVITLDATKLAAAAGSSRTSNTVLLGGLLSLGVVEVTEESLFLAMEERWSARLVQINKEGYRLGYQHIQELKRATDKS